MNKIKSILGLGFSIARSEFIQKNEGTWLGILWYLLAPVLTFIFLLGIFQDRLGNDIPEYPLYLLLGILMFNFFRNITTESVSLIKRKSGLINSLNFHREALVVALVIKTLFAHIFEIIILFCFLLFFGISIYSMIFYPIILVLLVIFSLGAGLILSAIGAYFFDLENIWGFGVNIIWFITPIFYEIGGGEKLFILNQFNPMYFIITFAREIIIYTKFPDPHIILGTVGYSLLAWFVGIFIFKKLKSKFSELV